MSAAPVLREVHGPLDDREIAILNADAPHLQSGVRVGPSQCLLSSLVIELDALAVARPFRQQLRGRFSAVGEGERSRHRCTI